MGYAGVTTLKAFEGCYQNLSESLINRRGAVVQASTQYSLAGMIWPDYQFKDNTRPDAILVKAISEKTLEVSAMRGGVVQKTDSFENGKDFWFESGHLELRPQFMGSAATQPGNVFIGVAAGTTTLGIDARGDGRSVQSMAAAGTVFLIIPVAAGVRDTRRYKRNEALCTEK